MLFPREPLANEMRQVDMQQRASHVGPPFTGHFKIICDTPRGLQPWQPSADPTVLEGKKNSETENKATTGAAPKGDLNLEIGRNIYEASAKGTKLNKADGKTNGETPTTNGVSGTSLEEVTKAPITKVNCFQCGIDCTRTYYHYTKSDPSSNTKYDLCPSCCLEGRMPNNHLKSQYTRVENPTYTHSLDRDAPWSDAETLRLLEGLERYDDDWGEIAEHVGTRTREECVLRFLQLDIEEKYLDSDFASINAPVGLPLLGTQGGQLPFSQADNPVMSVVGFLASLADPASTAAAANKSADELKRRLRSKLGEKQDGEAVTNGKDKAGEGSDSMDLDIKTTTTQTTTTTTTTSSSTVASIPLASIGARSAGFASHEEREMTRLVSAAANVMLQKLELKLKYFNDMEGILQAEKRELERGRQQLFLDRLAFKKRVRDAQEGLKAAAAAGGEAGARMALDIGGEGERLGFQAGDGPANVQPLSSEGQVKTFEA